VLKIWTGLGGGTGCCWADISKKPLYPILSVCAVVQIRRDEILKANLIIPTA